MINQMISMGIFSKVQKPSDRPEVWVRPPYFALDLEEKETSIKVAYAFYFNGSEPGRSVWIVDSLSGKDVGHFTMTNGLSLDRYR